jgi:hypothetical protein
MHGMESQVVRLPRRPPRSRRPRPQPVAPVPAGPLTGRAWINGREVGGTDRRLEHLATGSD